MVIIVKRKNSIKNYVSLLAYMRAEKIIDASLFPKTLYKIIEKYPEKKHKLFPLGRPISIFFSKTSNNNVTKKYSNKNLNLLSCGRAVHEKGVG